jgi:hypothetical protein
MSESPAETSAFPLSRRWAYFALFLTANSFIAYAHLPFAAQLAIGLLGLALPGAFALRACLLNKTNSAPADGAPPLWLWALFAALFLLVRFIHLTRLPFWPHFDDGIFGFLGMGQMRQWRWDLLYGQFGIEPLMIWSLGLYFKVLPPSFFSLRLYPTLLSIASIPLAYWAARQYFSKWISFFFCAFIAFSFWDMVLSRFCFPGGWSVIFGSLGSGLLALVLKSASPWKPLVLLALLGGLGFYMAPTWGAAWLALALVLSAAFYSRDKKVPLVYLGVSLLIALPMILARLAPGGLAHFKENLGSVPLQTLGPYLACLFWKFYPSLPDANSWGGWLNPLTDSLILMGFLEAVRTRSKTLGVLLIGIFFLLLPAVVTSGIEVHRVLPTAPALMIFAAVGLWGLMGEKADARSLSLAALLFAVSFALDGYHFVDRYCDIRYMPDELQGRSVPNAQVYDELRERNAKEGPMMVMADFNAVSGDNTLNIVCYPFNTLENPKLAAARPRWIALVAKIDLAPYLLERFHGCEMRFLSAKKVNHLPDALFLIPAASLDAPTLDRWIKASRICWDLDWAMVNKPQSRSSKVLVDQLMENKPLFAADPYLTTVFWEKIGLMRVIDRDLAGAQTAYRAAIAGLPLAHLYHNEGLCDRFLGQTQEAQKAFKQETRLGLQVDRFLRVSR